MSRKIDKIRLFVDKLNISKPYAKYKFDVNFPWTDNEIIRKCLFIYFWLFGPPKLSHEIQFERFCEILSLCHYVFFKENISIDINSRIYELLEKIYKKQLERDFCKFLFQKQKENIKTFKEMEFLSFTLFFSRILKAMKFREHKYIQLKNKNLKLKTREAVMNLNLHSDKYDVDEMFEMPISVSVYDWFNGNFESGVENIFQGSIPLEMNDKDLYNVIQIMQKELK